jgi:signal transduction histidine kinase
MLPLTVLQGHLTTLRRRVEAGTLPDKDTVRDALEESHYLSSLLQNLRRGGAPGGRRDADRAPSRRRQCTRRARPSRASARSRRTSASRFDYSVPEAVVWVDGDVTLVEQMLSNVIHNAVRYGHEGGHVAVLLEERGTEPARFSLRVVDDGPGIPADLHGRVVERSFRTDEARTRHPDGLGLGLSIAKDVAERHGFALEMRPRSAGGLEVEFSGPRASNGSAAKGP